MLEAQLQREVRTLIAGAGLLTVALPRLANMGNPPGWPDLMILGPRGLLFRELKSADGRPSRAQLAIGGILRQLGQDWAIWRPADLDSGRIGRELWEIA